MRRNSKMTAARRRPTWLAVGDGRLRQQPTEKAVKQRRKREKAIEENTVLAVEELRSDIAVVIKPELSDSGYTHNQQTA